MRSRKLENGTRFLQHLDLSQMVLFPILGMAVAIVGCQPVDQADAALKEEVSRALAARPALDRSSPDRTVESWWAMQAWWDEHRSMLTCGRRIPIVGQLFETNLDGQREIFEGELERKLTQPGECGPPLSVQPTYSRTILGVEMETQTRATVDARIQNSTPVPENIALSAGNRADREIGQPVRYVLSKRGEQWTIESILIGKRPLYFDDDSGQPSYYRGDAAGEYEALDLDQTDNGDVYPYVWVNTPY